MENPVKNLRRSLKLLPGFSLPDSVRKPHVHQKMKNTQNIEIFAKSHEQPKSQYKPNQGPSLLNLPKDGRQRKEQNSRSSSAYPETQTSSLNNRENTTLRRESCRCPGTAAQPAESYKYFPACLGRCVQLTLLATLV